MAEITKQNVPISPQDEQTQDVRREPRGTVEEEAAKRRSTEGVGKGSERQRGYSEPQ